MKLGIIGTRGIPNHYGGFEQFAENFAVYMVAHGHQVAVYNSSLHPYLSDAYKGVQIIKKYDPENRIGTAGQFVYDALCIADSRKRNFDIILQLGYTSSSAFSWLMPSKACIVTNMDGMEWKRSKYSSSVQQFLRKAEKWAVNNSDFLIADSIGIQQYLAATYNKPSEYIPYGAAVFEQPDKNILSKYELLPNAYNLVVARMEPENNVETIIKARLAIDSAYPLVIIGNYSNVYGQYLYKQYSSDKIRFLNGIYDQNILNNLRHFSALYFHGHSVGGTNPSLIEAMACACPIIAHDNVFNRSILNEDALYFNDEKTIVDQLNTTNDFRQALQNGIDNNTRKVKTIYHPDTIHSQLENFLTNCVKT
ncbi:MAG: DUF1972 domain-containing protein [Bacteroidota bacterium]